MNNAFTTGRYGPIHFGHVSYLKKMIETHDHTVIGLGSCHTHCTFRNSIAAVYREKMIRAALESQGICDKQYDIIYIQDYPKFEDWMRDIFTVLKTYHINDFVTGNTEDILDEFQRLQIDLGDVNVVNPELTSDFAYHSSDGRRALLRGDMDLVEKIYPQSVLQMMFGNKVLRELFYAEENRSIEFIPGRQTVDMVVLLRDKNSRQIYLLAGKRSAQKEDFPGFWGLPGGEIPKFHTSIQAAIDALKEKTGLKIQMWKNITEPAVVTLPDISCSQIEFLHFLGIFSSQKETENGTQGGSSQCFGLLLEGDLQEYTSYVQATQDLEEVAFYPLPLMEEKEFAYQQRQMIQHAARYLLYDEPRLANPR